MDLLRRFINHKYLTGDIARIDYIECNTHADMIWKRIYYINLYYSADSRNVSDVYDGGITNLNLNDNWKIYRKRNKENKFNEKYFDHLADILKNNNISRYVNLIHIIDNKKLNQIGEDKFALSKEWFKIHQEDNYIKTLSNNVTNYFRNIVRAKSKECMWTTFYATKANIVGKGFRRGFIGLNEDSTEFSRCYLAYLCNNFYPHNYYALKINEDTRALYDLLHFIFNSAIRDGKEIWIYIPSVRMRRLLNSWIEENSIE